MRSLSLSILFSSDYTIITNVSLISSSAVVTYHYLNIAQLAIKIINVITNIVS